MRSSILQLSVSLLEEQLELLLDPGDHLLVLVQNATLAKKQREQSVFVGRGVRPIRKRLVNRLQSLFKVRLQVLLRVFLEAEQVVEQNDGRIEDNFGVAARKAITTKLN